MQRITASGTSPSTGPPAASRSRTSELETATCGPSTRSTRQPGGTAGAGVARAGHDGQGDQALQVLGPVPGSRARGPDRPRRPGRARRAGPRRRRAPPRPCRPSSWGRPGRSRAGWPRRPGSPGPGPRSARSGPRRPRSRAAPTSARGRWPRRGAGGRGRAARWRPAPRPRARRAAGRRSRRGSRCGWGAQVPASSAITGASASISASCTTMLLKPSSSRRLRSVSTISPACRSARSARRAAGRA